MRRHLPRVRGEPCRAGAAKVKPDGANDEGYGEQRRTTNCPPQRGGRAISVKQEGKEMVGATGIEPVTPPV